MTLVIRCSSISKIAPARHRHRRPQRAASCRTGLDRRKAEGSDWLLDAAAAVQAAEDEDDGVLRLLSDDELDQYPDPAAVLARLRRRR
jgi:hypothetical protein